jgi:competence protein ComEC
VQIRASNSWIDVPGPQLLVLTERRVVNDSPAMAEHITAWRLIIRSGLDRALSKHASARARALVNAIVLGIRTRDFDEISEPYRRTGLAHYLAVSGFALGVLVAIPALVLLTASPMVRGVVIMIVVTLGLLAIDLRAPALRAGVVACAAALGTTLGRDWNRHSLLALAALILLLIDPMEILRAGFQLSFTVVAALILLAPVLARRLPGPVARLDGRLRSLPFIWTPIVMHHFGILSPVGIALSIVAAPLVVAIVAFSITAIIASLVLPALAPIPAMIAAWSAELLDNSAVFCSQVPGACLVLPSPSFIWVLCAEFLLWRWVLHVRTAERTFLVAGTLLLLVFFVAASTHTTPRKTLEVLTLDVGNGSCHVVSGPSGSILVDAGSSTISSCAQRIIAPALGAKGITFLEAIVLTHANLDHFSAAGDLISRIRVGKIIIGESFLARARSEQSGPAATFLHLTESWHIPVEVVCADDLLIIGGLRWHFLHPEAASNWSIENNSSLVVRVEHLSADPEEPAAILFTGDIEEEAMRHLLEHRKTELRANILEAPHHGSVRRSTKSFIENVDPDVIVQSSGYRRLKHDEFGLLLESHERAVTARSGAIHLRHTHHGICSLMRFRDSGKPPVQFGDPGPRPR